jgi:hypothetical protein
MKIRKFKEINLKLDMICWLEGFQKLMRVYWLWAGRLRSLKRDEARAVRGADAGTSVLHRFVCQGELSQVVTNHFGLHTSAHNTIDVMHVLCTSLELKAQRDCGARHYQ